MNRSDSATGRQGIPNLALASHAIDRGRGTRRLPILLTAAMGLALVQGCGRPMWRPDLGGAMQLAARKNAMVLVAYWSALDEECMRMEQEVFSQEDVQATLREVIPVRLDALFNRKFAETYGLNRVPAFVMFGPDGRVLRMSQGYMNEGRFRGFVQAARLSY